MMTMTRHIMDSAVPMYVMTPSARGDKGSPGFRSYKQIEHYIYNVALTKITLQIAA